MVTGGGGGHLYRTGPWQREGDTVIGQVHGNGGGDTVIGHVHGNGRRGTPL